MHCYWVTMAITNFVRAALNRVVNEESVHTKFAGFNKDLVLAFLTYSYKLVKTHISYGSNGRLTSSSVIQRWNLFIWWCNGRKSLKKYVIIYYVWNARWNVLFICH